MSHKELIVLTLGMTLIICLTVMECIAIVQKEKTERTKAVMYGIYRGLHDFFRTVRIKIKDGE